MVLRHNSGCEYHLISKILVLALIASCIIGLRPNPKIENHEQEHLNSIVGLSKAPSQTEMEARKLAVRIASQFLYASSRLKKSQSPFSYLNHELPIDKVSVDFLASVDRDLYRFVAGCNTENQSSSSLSRSFPSNLPEKEKTDLVTKLLAVYEALKAKHNASGCGEIPFLNWVHLKYPSISILDGSIEENCPGECNQGSTEDAYELAFSILSFEKFLIRRLNMHVIWVDKSNVDGPTLENFEDWSLMQLKVSETIQRRHFPKLFTDNIVISHALELLCKVFEHVFPGEKFDADMFKENGLELKERYERTSFAEAFPYETIIAPLEILKLAYNLNLTIKIEDLETVALERDSLELAKRLNIIGRIMYRSMAKDLEEAMKPIRINTPIDSEAKLAELFSRAQARLDSKPFDKDVTPKNSPPVNMSKNSVRPPFTNTQPINITSPVHQQSVLSHVHINMTGTSASSASQCMKGGLHPPGSNISAIVIEKPVLEPVGSTTSKDEDYGIGASSDNDSDDDPSKQTSKIGSLINRHEAIKSLRETIKEYEDAEKSNRSQSSDEHSFEESLLHVLSWRERKAKKADIKSVPELMMYSKHMVTVYDLTQNIEESQIEDVYLELDRDHEEKKEKLYQHNSSLSDSEDSKGDDENLSSLGEDLSSDDNSNQQNSDDLNSGNLDPKIKRSASLTDVKNTSEKSELEENIESEEDAESVEEAESEEESSCSQTNEKNDQTTDVKLGSVVLNEDISTTSTDNKVTPQVDDTFLKLGANVSSLENNHNLEKSEETSPVLKETPKIAVVEESFDKNSSPSSPKDKESRQVNSQPSATEDSVTKTQSEHPGTNEIVTQTDAESPATGEMLRDSQVESPAVEKGSKDQSEASTENQVESFIAVNTAQNSGNAYKEASAPAQVELPATVVAQNRVSVGKEASSEAQEKSTETSKGKALAETFSLPKDENEQDQLQTENDDNLTSDYFSQSESEKSTEEETNQKVSFLEKFKEGVQVAVAKMGEMMPKPGQSSDKSYSDRASSIFGGFGDALTTWKTKIGDKIGSLRRNETNVQFPISTPSSEQILFEKDQTRVLEPSFGIYDPSWEVIQPKVDLMKKDPEVVKKKYSKTQRQRRGKPRETPGISTPITPDTASHDKGSTSFLDRIRQIMKQFSWTDDDPSDDSGDDDSDDDGGKGGKENKSGRASQDGHKFKQHEIRKTMQKHGTSNGNDGKDDNVGKDGKNGKSKSANDNHEDGQKKSNRKKVPFGAFTSSTSTENTRDFSLTADADGAYRYTYENKEYKSYPMLKSEARKYFNSVQGFKEIKEIIECDLIEGAHPIQRYSDLLWAFPKKAFPLVSPSTAMLIRPQCMPQMRRRHLALLPPQSFGSLLADQIHFVRPKALKDVTKAQWKALSNVAMEAFEDPSLAKIVGFSALRVNHLKVLLSKKEKIASVNPRCFHLVPMRRLAALKSFYFRRLPVEFIREVRRENFMGDEKSRKVMFSRLSAKQMASLPKHLEDEDEHPFSKLDVDLHALPRKVLRQISPLTFKVLAPSSYATLGKHGFEHLSSTVKRNLCPSVLPKIPTDCFTTRAIAELSFSNIAICEHLNAEHLKHLDAVHPACLAKVTPSVLGASLLDAKSFPSQLFRYMPADVFEEVVVPNLEELSEKISQKQWGQLDARHCESLKISAVRKMSASASNAFWKGISADCLGSLQDLHKLHPVEVSAIPDVTLQALSPETKALFPVLVPAVIQDCSKLGKIDLNDFSTRFAKDPSCLAQIPALSIRSLKAEQPLPVDLFAHADHRILANLSVSILERMKKEHWFAILDARAFRGVSPRMLKYIPLAELPLPAYEFLPPHLFSALSAEQLNSIPQEAFTRLITREQMKAVNPKAMEEFNGFDWIGTKISPSSKEHPCCGITDAHLAVIPEKQKVAFRKQCTGVFASQKLEASLATQPPA